jgi:hypothetical protein
LVFCSSEWCKQYSQRETRQQLLQKSPGSFQPHLCIISQTVKFDKVHFVEIYRKLNFPYAIILQKAADFYFSLDEYRSTVRSTYQAAVKSLFVSQDDLDSTQQNLQICFCKL